MDLCPALPFFWSVICPNGRDMSLTGRDMSCGRDILPNGKAICLAARYAPYGARDALTGVGFAGG